MNGVRRALDELSALRAFGYSRHNDAATEPTALAALALAHHGRVDVATRVCQELVAWQDNHGSLGVGPTESAPRWPTSLATLAWLYVDRQLSQSRFGSSAERAIAWTLSDRGKSAPQQAHIGHDTTLVGWSWAANTHSWIEPTALFVTALKSGRRAEHQRTREGVRLLVDRLLPDGGCNYGNTIVLGQALLPHVQPTGLALLALRGEAVDDARLKRSIDYLKRTVWETRAAPSLSYASLAVFAHTDQQLAEAQLERTFDRVHRRGSSAYELALLLLAARPLASPFWTLFPHEA